MNKYVALFRGLNVGGHNKITMVDLKLMLTQADCQSVSTYIQSGNAVFSHELAAGPLCAKLEDNFEKQFGYRVSIVIRCETELKAALNAYPYFDETRELKLMMTGFARQKLSDDAQSVLSAAAIEGELVNVSGDEVHFYFGNGAGRSKLGALNFVKKIGTPITIRNRRTISKLVDMLNQT
ncbi:DUF1697 domain-containing protein [Maritalea sp.]|uniref:DUF1697 domain-containing protein n=1 Tax=Maritalea sp. TaxID=2003361 RepID=UPI003EF928B8